MTHRITSLFQFFLFSIHQIGLCQFVALETQEVCILSIPLDTLFEFFEFSLDLLVLFKGLLVLCQFLLIFSEDVDHAQLEVLLIEQQILML